MQQFKNLGFLLCAFKTGIKFQRATDDLRKFGVTTAILTPDVCGRGGPMLRPVTPGLVELVDAETVAEN